MKAPSTILTRDSQSLCPRRSAWERKLVDSRSTFACPYAYEYLLRSSRQVLSDTPTFPSSTISVDRDNARRYHHAPHLRRHGSPALSLRPPTGEPPPQRKKSPPIYPYNTSTVRDWPSRDPIGEYGGINLYGMVGNNAVGRWDFLGLNNGDVKAKMTTDLGAPKKCGCYTLFGRFNWAKIISDHSRKMYGLNVGLSLTVSINKGESKDCCKCDSVKTIQFVSSENFPISPGRKNRTGGGGFRIDVGGGDYRTRPFVSDTQHGGHGTSPGGPRGPMSGGGFEIGVRDAPQERRTNLDWANLKTTGDQAVGKKMFYTCAICASGSNRGEILGCMSWGFTFHRSTINQGTDVGLKNIQPIPPEYHCAGPEVEAIKNDAFSGWNKANPNIDLDRELSRNYKSDVH